jgi:hypothetical protein
MLDIIKNKIELNEFKEYLENQYSIENYVFDVIEMVINNPEYLPYLELIYKRLNNEDLNILQNIKDKDNQTIYELYKSIKTEDPNLKIHMNTYINSNIPNILSLFNMPKEIPKSLNDIIIERIEKLEKEVEELKIRITDKDLVSNHIR